MADLGNLYFDILLRDMTDKDIDRIKKKLEKIGVKIGADVNRKTLEKNIREALKNKTFKVNLEAGKNIKKAAIEANKSILTNSVSNALKGKVFTADLKLAIKSATVQDAIKQAFAKAGLQYNTTASDVRAQRIAEIQQRMAIRAANAQRNLGNSYRYAANGAYESARASVVLGRSFHTNIRLAGELGTAMGNFASVFGIKDVLENLVHIGGQLENQRIALGAILQDGGKATEMFGKIQSLAVKSPFGIMDLNQYIKQLSAYGIEYNELYDTMKRMADISAGVGVDMGRIILAFGQVKAAGFLKGTELRQFTEANIPMVDKLAERFSNLEKRIVSAGEVYDMISKKKVTFEDVKSVLWDLTGEGGMFNNMQEVLSESLASKWKNLADAIDVMYGKIADGAIGGGLKNLAVFLTELTKNWEYLATAIGSASAAFVAYKASVAIGSGKGAYGVYNIIAANHQLEVSNLRIARSYRALSASEQGVLATKERFTAAELRQAAAAGVLTKEMTLRLIAMGKISVAQAGHLKQILGITRAEIAAAAATSKWKVALAVFGNTLNGVWLTMKAMLLSPWTWAFAGITAITELFTYYGKKQDEIEERNKNFAESAKGSAETLERELLKIKDLDISKMNTDEMKIKVKELTTVIQNEADGWQSILSEIFAKEADGTFKNSVEEQLKLLKIKMDELAEAKKRLMKDDESYSDVIGETETGALFWEKDIIDRVKAYSQAVDENDKKLKDLAIHARDVSASLTAATSNNAVIQQVFNGKSLNEQVAILKDYKDEWSKFIVELTKSSPEAAQIVNSWFNSIEKFFVKGKNAEMMWDFGVAKKKMIEELTLQGEEVGKLTETGRQYVIGFVEGLIKEAAVQKPSVQQYIYDWFTGQFGLPRNDLEYIVPTDAFGGNKTEYDPSKDEVAKLWKKRAEEIDKAVKIYDKWKAIKGKLFAENRVKSSDEFANLFSGAYGFNLDLESPTDAYEYIQKLLDSSKSKQKELMVNLGVKISDAEYNDAKREFDKRLNELKEYAKDTVSKWELYKKLFDATGDKDFAKSAFDNTQVWDDAAREMKKNLEEEMDKQGSLVELDFTISDESAKEAFEGKSGLYELWKEIKDRIEKNGIDVKVNAAKAIESVQSIQDKIKSKKAQRDDELKLYSEGTQEYDSVAKKWENEITELEGELYELSPAFKSLFVDTTGMASGKVHELWQQAKNLVDLIRNNTTKVVYDQNGQIKGRYYKDNEGKEQYISEESFKNLGEQTNKLAKKVPEVKVAFNNLWDAIRGNGKEGYKFKDIAQDVSVLAKEAANTASALSSMFDSLGDESAADVASFTGDMLNSVSQIGEGIASGNPLAVISGIANGISSIAQFHDKKLDRAIKKSQLEVQKLSNEYKNLEATLERQLGSATAGQAAKMMDSLKKQRIELQKQYEAEDDKKKTDQSKLEDYKQQIAELDDQIKHFYDDLANEQYGIDIKGWASEIADALTEAFASGEDAAVAFEKTVSNIIKSLVKDMIAMEIIEPAMESVKKYLFGDKGIATLNSAGGTDITNSEAAGLANEMMAVSSSLKDAQKLWDEINKASGGMLDSVEGVSGGLSKEIQGVTEDTANLLGSYLNSIRQDSSVQRTLIEQLVSVDVPQMSIIAQAQLQQLQQVAANTKRNADATDRIYDLVNRVVDKGSNKLKV